MKRRDFVRVVSGVVVTGSALAAIGCSGGDDGGGIDSGGGNIDSGGNPGCSTAIGANHGHAMTVSDADVTAAADKTYDISGAAGHPHTVMISAAQFGMLAAGSSVMITSSTDAAHSHIVTVSGCA